MRTTKRICSHNIEFDFCSKSKKAVPTFACIELVKQLVGENHTSGKLSMFKLINNREYEFRGGWKILKE